jgi:hypothetical protein
MYRLEALLMPRFLAARGMKRYPADLGLGHKLGMNIEDLRPDRARPGDEELT